MAYPSYRRSGNTFYKVVSEELITKIEPDENVDFYQHCGKTTEDEATVMAFNECPVQDWNTVCNDLSQTARVGSRPSIPPPH